MAKIFIFRHGQTDDNINKIFSGWRQADLTEAGKKEAAEIGEKLKDEAVTKAYCSDLIRSKHTLEIALQPHPLVQIVEDSRIKERNYGDLTGSSKTELKEKDPEDFAKWHRSFDNPPPGGESIKDISVRVDDFIHDMMENIQPADVIFIAAHGNSIRPMRMYFEHLSPDEASTYEYTPAEIFSYVV